MAKYHPNEPLPPAPMFYVVDYRALDRVRRVMRRLFEERRMDGDAMRDAAQSLELTMREAEPFGQKIEKDPPAPARAFRVPDPDVNPESYFDPNGADPFGGFSGR